MRGTRCVYLALWILVFATLLKNSLGGPSIFKSKRNSTSNDSRSLTPQASVGIPRRLPSPWGGKFPLRSRSRHQTSSTSTSTTTTSDAPTTTTVNTTPQPETKTPSNATENELFRRRMDSIDSSASDNPLSVVWPLRKRPAASKRFRIPTPTTPAPQVLLKLLQPKPTRPAIYSLDGFVPKPSIQRFVSTEAPLNFGKTDLQLLSSSPRQRKVNRYSKEEDNEGDYRYERRRRKKPVSRYTAFARKGVPGEDYPVFTYIPQTEFDCGAQPGPGLYADPFTDCQVWHMCPGGNLSPRHSFLCPNGTIFNQKKRICDWWYNVDCHKHSRKIRSTGVDQPAEKLLE